ncbi:hypothetical protein Q1695_010777 [Nippostrongylus brasiliensis]|nr:hypothetical protein Q1695_010777 [Nippostrongylus brasiliensis]
MSDDSPLTEDTMMIDDCKIGYCRYGHGPMSVLCICGAVGCYKKDWPLSVLQHFDKSLVTMICIDPPGYGVSRPPDRVQEVNRCMKDAGFCLKLMEGLQLVPFTVIGWSEGSRTAIHVAAQGGSSTVNKMVLCAAGSKVSKLGAMAFFGMRNTDHWLPSARAPYTAHYSEDYLRTQWAGLCSVVQQVYDFCGGRFPCDYVLPKIVVPTLILNGGQDRFCGDAKVCFLSVLKKARLEVHAQGGHDFYMKYPKWFSEKVQSFLKET